MPARACRHENQAIDAGFERLFGMPDRDHVVQHNAAIAMDGVEHGLGRRPQRRNDDRHLVAHAHLDIVLEALIGLMHDLIDRDRPDLDARIGRLKVSQFEL